MCILAGVDAAAEAALAFTTLKPHQPLDLAAGAAAEAPACAPDCGIPKLPKLADDAAGAELRCRLQRLHSRCLSEVGTAVCTYKDQPHGMELRACKHGWS